MTLFVILIDMCILANIGFFAYNLAWTISLRNALVNDDESIIQHPSPVLELTLMLAPVSFLMIAVIANMNMWIRFLFKIDVMAGSLSLKQVQEREGKRIKSCIRLLDAVSVVVILVVASYTLAVVIDHERYIPSKSDDSGDDD